MSLPQVLQGWTFSLLYYTSCQPHTFLSHLPQLSENTPATSSAQTRWLCPRNFFSWCCKHLRGGNQVRKHTRELRLSRNQKVSSFFCGSQLPCAVTQTVLSAKLARRLKLSPAPENSKQGPPGSARTACDRWRKTQRQELRWRSQETQMVLHLHTHWGIFLKTIWCQIGSAPSLSLCTSFLVTIPSLLLFTIMLGIGHQIELGLCLDSIICLR